MVGGGSLLSEVRILALQSDLEAVRAGRRELEDEVRALREGLRQMEKVKEAAATESEEIMKALQGQVDSANKVMVLLPAWCAYSFFASVGASLFSVIFRFELL